MSIKRVIQARSNLLLDEAFFGVLALRLKLLEDNSQPTMWTDGQRLGFNAKFVESLTMAELTGVIAHEVMHAACGHIWRRGSRDKEAWNYFADGVINPIVLDAGMRLPKGAVDLPHCRGKAVEQVYEEPKKNGKGGCPKGFGGGFGEVRDTPTPVDAQAEEQEWKQATLQAAQAAMVKGKLPAGLERLVDAIRFPAVNWRAALRRFFETVARNDYSWQRPNKRYLSSGLYMPALKSEQLPPIAVAVDTSGSISTKMLEDFASELTAIVDETKPERVHVIYCDAQVQKVEEYEAGETITLKPKGGGGTAFAPPIIWLEEHGIDPACLVYLTDLYGSFPDDAPNYPTLWTTMTRGVDVPFGEVLVVEQWK